MGIEEKYRKQDTLGGSQSEKQLRREMQMKEGFVCPLMCEPNNQNCMCVTGVSVNLGFDLSVFIWIGCTCVCTDGCEETIQWIFYCHALSGFVFKVKSNLK